MSKKKRNRNNHQDESQTIGYTQDKIHFTIHDLNSVQTQTDAQHQAFKSYFIGNNLLLQGSAGTGKTFIALYLALNDLLKDGSTYDNIIVSRSIVPTRDIGFLPGTLEDKIAEYEVPYISICDELFEYNNSYNNLKKLGMIKFIPTSFIRGLTFENSIVIMDETQNMTLDEASSVITRAGNNTKLIVVGDTKQNDLTKNRFDVSGLKDLSRILERMDEFDVIDFTVNDIVRSELVRSFLVSKEHLRL